MRRFDENEQAVDSTTVAETAGVDQATTTTSVDKKAKMRAFVEGETLWRGQMETLGGLRGKKWRRVFSAVLIENGLVAFCFKEKIEVCTIASLVDALSCISCRTCSGRTP